MLERVSATESFGTIHELRNFRGKMIVNFQESSAQQVPVPVDLAHTFITLVERAVQIDTQNRLLNALGDRNNKRNYGRVVESKQP